MLSTMLKPIRSLSFFFVAALLCGAPDTVDAAGYYYTTAPAPTCSVNGYGTWGPILKVCVKIDNYGKGTFTVTKKDGSNFTTGGMASLRIGSINAEPVGKVFPKGGESKIVLTDVVKWYDYTESGVKFHIVLESNGGGWTTVGPLVIYKKWAN